MDKESFQEMACVFSVNCSYYHMKTRSFMVRLFTWSALIKLGNGWMDVLEPNPVPFFEWLLIHYNGVVEFAVVNGDLIFISDRLVDGGSVH